MESIKVPSFWERKSTKEIITKIILYIIILAGAFIFMIPFFWMLSTALKGQEEAFQIPPQWIPNPVHWENFSIGWNTLPFWLYLKNTVIIIALSLVGQLLSASLVAFGFSRLQFTGRDILFFIMLSTMMIPPQALIVPQYVLFNKINWVGTFNPIVIPGYFAGGASMVFLLRQSMSQIPKELDESAFVDGASHFQIWWNIVLPLVRAPLATVSTFLFVGLWNNLLGPLMYLQSVGLYTLPVYTSTLYNINQTVQPWPTIMAAAVLTTVPLIIVFFFAQRYILEGVVVTGMKG